MYHWCQSGHSIKKDILTTNEDYNIDIQTIKQLILHTTCFITCFFIYHSKKAIPIRVMRTKMV